MYLKTLYLNGNASKDYLDIITNQLVDYGLRIHEYRKEFIKELDVPQSAARPLKTRNRRRRSIAAIVVAIAVVLLGTGTALASTTTFVFLLGNKMVELEWEPIEQFDINGFNEYCRQIDSDACPDLDKAEELTGIKLIKTDRFKIELPLVSIYEPAGEVKFSCDIWIDGKGAKVNAIAVLPGYEDLVHGYGITEFRSLTKYEYAPGKTAYIILDSSSEIDTYDYDKYVGYFSHDGIMYQVATDKSYGLDFSKMVIDYLTEAK